jgi:hypothetical protein
MPENNDTGVWGTICPQSRETNNTEIGYYFPILAQFGAPTPTGVDA